MVELGARDGPAGGILDDTATLGQAAPRPLGIVLVLAGLSHLAAPGALLWLASLGYDRVLAVDFDPDTGARRRVRALGLAMVLAGGHLLYHGRVVPE
jgi:hypothetical protein